MQQAGVQQSKNSPHKRRPGGAGWRHKLIGAGRGQAAHEGSACLCLRSCASTVATFDHVYTRLVKIGDFTPRCPQAASRPINNKLSAAPGAERAAALACSDRAQDLARADTGSGPNAGSAGAECRCSRTSTHYSTGSRVPRIANSQRRGTNPQIGGGVGLGMRLRMRRLRQTSQKTKVAWARG